MKRSRSYLLLVGVALLATGFLLPVTNALPIHNRMQDDSVRVKELLLIDTVDLKIHGPSQDVNFYMNGMVFLSNTKYHQKMIPDHITFGVVKAFFVPLEYVALESSRPLFKNDDFPYPPGGMSFTRDYKKVYFTKMVEVNSRRNAEKIFEMSIINGEASTHEQLSFTGDPSRYLHPAISLDDSFMIFASDRTPSNGGLDLFISQKTPAGWSAPANMGSEINTSGHEWFPYLDHDNNLFFSSTGHMGYGGYDVFVCFFNGSNWDPPKNMTEYINTTEDEIGFSIHPNRKTALYSTVKEIEAQGEVFQMSLNRKALLLSGIEDPENQDISGYIKDLLETGYTTGAFAAPSDDSEQVAFSFNALPLISDGEESPQPEAEPEPEPEPVKEAPVVEAPVVEAPVRQEPVQQPPVQPEPVQRQPEPEPEPIIETPLPETVIAEPAIADEPELDPNRVVFRVQILSSSKANSSPSVTIAGTRYPTFEYFYKGAYRVTVGEFETVQEASNFRASCRSAGFNQAFVAAFRGNERETDPSVFRK